MLRMLFSLKSFAGNTQAWLAKHPGSVEAAANHELQLTSPTGAVAVQESSNRLQVAQSKESGTTLQMQASENRVRGNQVGTACIGKVRRNSSCCSQLP